MNREQLVSSVDYLLSFFRQSETAVEDFAVGTGSESTHDLEAASQNLFQGFD